MRKNQIEITVRRFGDDDVPTNLSGEHIIHVYSDSNNLYEALGAALHKLLTELGKYTSIPEFGVAEASSLWGN